MAGARSCGGQKVDLCHRGPTTFQTSMQVSSRRSRFQRSRPTMTVGSASAELGQTVGTGRVGRRRFVDAHVVAWHRRGQLWLREIDLVAAFPVLNGKAFRLEILLPILGHLHGTGPKISGYEWLRAQQLLTYEMNSSVPKSLACISFVIGCGRAGRRRARPHSISPVVVVGQDAAGETQRCADEEVLAC